MLLECHVFDPLLAAIFNQRKHQSVVGRAGKLIDARPGAEFRGLTACFLDCDSILSHRNIAPNVMLRIDDIEGLVAFDRPDSAKRVCPLPDEGPLCRYPGTPWMTVWRVSGKLARIEQADQNANENDSERKL